MGNLHVSVDIGGTFTDCVVEAENDISFHKAPTTPDDPVRGLLDVLTLAAGDEGLRAFLSKVGRLVHGTTLGTNVLLTKTGARTGLITTEGFRDVTEMRRGMRNLTTSMFDQFKAPYVPLVPRGRRLGVPERTLYDGSVDRPLDIEATENAVRSLVEQGCESIAIAFLHSYANPANELLAKEIVERVAPDVYVVCSHVVVQTVGEFERFSSTVVSAYIGPSISEYLTELESRLQAEGFDGALLIMLSSGLMQTSEHARRSAVELLVSGPAAAPSAALEAARAEGLEDLLEVDMGGTSFEVCLIRDGVVPTTKEAWIGEERIGTKMIDVTSIGAGGGSIAWIDGLGLLRVGPQSAAADPGPAAYGRSDLATVTDADLVLGLLPSEYFLGGSVTVDVDHARHALGKVGASLGMSPDETALAVYQTVTATMADAVTEACTKKGHDVRRFAVIAGGGAGGVHGAAIAEYLGIPTVLFAQSGPVLSAMGMLTIDLGQELTRAGVWDRLEAPHQEVEGVFAELEAQIRASFEEMGVPESDVNFSRAVGVRYAGQFHELVIDLPEGVFDAKQRGEIADRFHARYKQLYGYSLPWREVEILEAHLRGQAASARVTTESAEQPGEPAEELTPISYRSCLIDGTRQATPVYPRDSLLPGHRLSGPALIDSSTSTIYVPPNFDCRINSDLTVVLTLRDAAISEDQSRLVTEGAVRR